MSETQPLTTAEALSRYYAELIEGGIPERVAGEMVLRASFNLVDEGLSVKAAPDA